MVSRKIFKVPETKNIVLSTMALKIKDFNMLISSEREETINALDIVRKIAQSVDGEMEEYKRNMKLEEISTNFDKTSISRYREKRFSKRELESRKISNYYLLI